MSIQPTTTTTDVDTDTADDKLADFQSALNTAWNDRDMTTGTIPAAALDRVGVTFRKLRGNAAKSAPAEFQTNAMGEIQTMTDPAAMNAGMTALMAIQNSLVVGATPTTPERVVVDPAIAYADAIRAIDVALDVIQTEAGPEMWERAQHMVDAGHTVSDKRVQKVVSAAYVKHGRERLDIGMADLIEAGTIEAGETLYWTIDDTEHRCTVNDDGTVSVPGMDGEYSLSAACVAIRPHTGSGKPASYRGPKCWADAAGVTILEHLTNEAS